MNLKTISYLGESKKVLRIISEEYPFIGYSYLQKILRKNDIKINGKRIKSDLVVNNGDIIEFFYDEKLVKITPKIVYQDENIAVFYKPKKIASKGKNSFEELVHSQVCAEYVLTHRLDTNTDGLIIFAKSEKVYDELKRSFKNHSVEKRYLAEVYGKVPTCGKYCDYIHKDSEKGKVYVYREKKDGYVEAILEYAPIKYTDESTILDIKLVTGRTHQIRAQLSYHCYPIIGDGKYGNDNINKKFGEKTQRLTAYKIIFNIKDGFLKYLDGKEILLENVKF